MEAGGGCIIGYPPCFFPCGNNETVLMYSSQIPQLNVPKACGKSVKVIIPHRDVEMEAEIITHTHPHHPRRMGRLEFHQAPTCLPEVNH